MYNIQKINQDWTFVGANTRRLKLFENIYPIPRGVSYNSYLLTDDKTVLRCIYETFGYWCPSR